MDEESASNSSVFRKFEGEEMMGKILLFAILSLVTGILFLLLIYLYARFFWWREEQHLNLNLTLSDDPGSTVIGRNNRRRRFVFAQVQEDPPCTTGLDSKILQSIDVLVFKSTDFKDGLECAVCLSDLVDGDKARVLPRCNHGFHVDCIDMWFQSHSTCPLCRNTVGSVEDTAHRGTEGLSQNQNFESGHSSNQHNPSQDQSPVLELFPTEPLSFPTNVLVWGDQNQVRSVDHVVTENSTSGNFEDDHQQESSGTNTCNRAQEVTAVVVDIRADSSEDLSERIDEEEPRSPMFTRLRSLKKFLSREKKDVVCVIGSSGANNNNV
ncbi:RING-H2 finger protein ATL60 [Cardamine amara subsp. amara]|uniref:RING-type E3 ubiquitin transferase n=1 Tax=Cardamine amara subsp. amara TaxID=228776 RepID=A0ABD1BNZ7_CARAN